MEPELLPIFFTSEIDIRKIWFGKESLAFIAEVFLRSVFMFIILLLSLRILGKRSVGQLSLFELVVIIGLGSAAGDPMIYKDVGLLSGTAAFIVVIGLYKLMTYLINQSRGIEKSLEGVPTYVAENGKFNPKVIEKEPVAQDELFIMLRREGITHLGQVKLVILETTGHISVVYFADNEIQWGLPILPHLFEQKTPDLPPGEKYACGHCGQIEETNTRLEQYACPRCNHAEWVKAIKDARIT